MRYHRSFWCYQCTLVLSMHFFYFVGFSYRRLFLSSTGKYCPTPVFPLVLHLGFQRHFSQYCSSYLFSSGSVLMVFPPQLKVARPSVIFNNLAATSVSTAQQIQCFFQQTIGRHFPSAGNPSNTTFSGVACSSPRPASS